MTSETRVRVRYAETDQMRVVYHANYLVWFEVGRVEHMRQLGIDYKSMERDEGVGIAVVEVTCRYKSPARYDDELTIRTRIAEVRGSIVRFAYAIHRSADDVLLAEGATTHIVVDRSMKRAAMPLRYATVFASNHGASATRDTIPSA
jgi:acyl-CoA thioester hydrolase